MKGGDRFVPHARQPRHPRLHSAAPEAAAHPGAGGWQGKHSPDSGESTARAAAQLHQRGVTEGCPRGSPRLRAVRRQGRELGAGPAPPLPPPGPASPTAALSPGAPLGCQKGAATCFGAESLLAARREGEQPPRRPRPGSYRCSRRRGKAAAASSRPRLGRSLRRAPVPEERASRARRPAPPPPPGPAAGRRDDGAPRRRRLRLLPPPPAAAPALPAARSALPAPR